MQEIIKTLSKKNLTIKFMESCTGGYMANLTTNIEGASAVLLESYVTYSNESKIAHGVPRQVIDQYTVYSQETAIAMAQACRQGILPADIGVGITGNFSNIDPKNATASQPGIVFISIITPRSRIVYTLKLPSGARSKQKTFIGNSIVKELKKLI